MMKNSKLNRRNWIRLLSLSGAGAFLGWQNPAPNSDPECLTTPDIEGPFYIPGAPLSPQLAPENAPGTPLFITGTVYANDCMTPIPNALVDVWHANDGGGYEDVHYRGKVMTDSSGNYAFQTILPGKYLNGAQFRPRHFHYKVSAMDHEVTTQIYFEGDTSIPIDPWASTPEAEERIIPLTEDNNGNLHGVTDIYLDVMPVINNSIDRANLKQSSFIEHIFPNPVHSEATTAVVLDQSASINLAIYDLKGKIVKNVVEDQQVSSGSHQYVFNANGTLGIQLPPGIYILRLSVDGQAVHAKRFMVR